MLIIDSFAGGGGASTGIEMALGRAPDVAINHNPVALGLHKANHPQTVHLVNDIWKVDPEKVRQGEPIGLLWASPDCKHFSKAKGGAPKDRNIRDLAWIVVDWAEKRRPDVILLENVEEFVTWGPVDNDGEPIRELAGHTFEDWVRRLKRAGYRVEWRQLRASDYGAPTIRKRLFVVARRDGRKIVWPKPTHGDPKSDAVKRGKLKPWRTAAEIVDWSLPCPSIFDDAATIMAKHGLRAVRPLADKTGARIARGVRRYVLDAAEPFLVILKGSDRRDASVGAPHPAVLAQGGHSALLTPTIARFNGDSDGRRADEPLSTVTANGFIKKPGGAAPLGVVAPHLMTMRDAGKPFQGADEPAHTITAGGAHQMLVAATFLAQHNDGPNAHVGARDPREPISTVTAKGSQQTPVAATIVKYYGTGDGQDCAEPLHTVVTKDRFGLAQLALAAPPYGPQHEARAREVAEFMRRHGCWDGGDLVTVKIGGVHYVVADIGMRMLTPRELFAAQGFPPGYRIDRTAEGRPLTKSEQIAAVGNSVSPPVARALAAANCGHLADTLQADFVAPLDGHAGQAAKPRERRASRAGQARPVRSASRVRTARWP